MANAREFTTDRVKRELHRALEDARADLERVEIWSAGLYAFSRPIPEYQPSFQHLNRPLAAHEIDGDPQISPKSSRRWRSEASE
jgi:hypothetical protein